MPTLVVGPSWVGDMILTQGLLMYLKSRRPDDSIHMLAPKWSLDIAHRMREVDTLIELPFGHGDLKLRERWGFARQLCGSQYHRAFILPNSFKSALIPAMAGIPRRIGWLGEYRYKLLNDVRILRADRFPRMIDRYMALAFPANLALTASQLPEAPENPRLIIDEKAQARLIKRHNLRPNRLIAICPGAEFSVEKQWPLDRFSFCIDRLCGAGYQIVLLGSPNDKEDAKSIIEGITQSHSNDILNLIGRTSIPEVIDIVGLARAVITNDSGLMHVAAATERPVIALFGPTSPSHTPPLTSRATIVESPTGSMKDIKADEIFETLIKITK